MEEKPEFTYIVTKPCGCICFCCVDYRDKETAKEISEAAEYAVMNGFDLKRLPVDEATPLIRARFGSCEACKEPEQLPLF